jgi:UDP-N-acetylglucosamine diphosphorylase / glucose-1-phosphate thymidylyltransferase / UDP-N-acetylgalactosamine diphosphorylase / glucosamine-1-phosphate N-acetyltransferase / galactosamine-1-phosphate N-acetyltransferase
MGRHYRISFATDSEEQMIVVVPMAGRGSRYSSEGYTIPKPLVEIAGKPMLWHAFQSLCNVNYSKLIFIALKEHQRQYDLEKLLRQQITDSFELVLLDDVTEGQLCTVLCAERYFQPGEGLLIAASDTYVVSNIGHEIDREKMNCDGIISVADLPGDHWSFARADEQGFVTQVAEKVRISDHASTGLYYFSDSQTFAREAKAMVQSQERTKGEFYVMPLYNKYIDKGRRIRLSLAGEMWDLGTPDAKRSFEQHLKSKVFKP